MPPQPIPVSTRCSSFMFHLVLQDLHPFFKHPVTKNLKAGGELAFGAASLTAITFPVVATMLSLGSIQAEQAALRQAVAAQAQTLADIAVTVHSIQSTLEKNWW